VLEGDAALGRKLAWKLWKHASLSRKMMNMGNRSMKNWMVNKLFKGWTAHRGDLDFSAKTFNELWKEKQ